MGDKTGIQWTDSTDNVIVVYGGGWWCQKISPECDNCYAEELNQNEFFGGNKLKYGGERPNLQLRQDILRRWSRQTKPRKHFVMSMSDWAGEFVPREWQFQILDAAAAAPLQTFQFLTKRANVAAKTVKLWSYASGITNPRPNLWFGFTAGDQKRFDLRWKEFKKIAQAGWTIFVSAEPLLGPIKLPLDFLELGKRAQVIVGGESGKNARPMHPDDARDLRDQCEEYGVAFFFKQWGEWINVDYAIRYFQYDPYGPHPRYLWTERTAVPYVWLGNKKVGRELDGKEWNQFPCN